MNTNSAITPQSEALQKRVLMVKKTYRLTIDSIASAAGMYRPTVTNQLNGKFNIDVRVLLAIAQLAPDVSADWLLRGVGEMRSASLSADLEARVSRLEKLLET